MEKDWRNNPKPVICIETGKRFKSAYQAAKTLPGPLKSNKSGVVRCCNGERNICKGFHWKYANKEDEWRV